MQRPLPVWKEPHRTRTRAEQGRWYLLVSEFKVHYININCRMFQGFNIQSSFHYFIQKCPSWGNQKIIQRMHDLSVTSKCGMKCTFPHTKRKWLKAFHSYSRDFSPNLNSAHLAAWSTLFYIFVLEILLQLDYEKNSDLLWWHYSTKNIKIILTYLDNSL